MNIPWFCFFINIFVLTDGLAEPIKYLEAESDLTKYINWQMEIYNAGRNSPSLKCQGTFKKHYFLFCFQLNNLNESWMANYIILNNLVFNRSVDKLSRMFHVSLKFPNGRYFFLFSYSRLVIFFTFQDGSNLGRTKN